MDIRKIESVCAVDMYKSYSEAAFQLSSSPAVLSKHISSVEEELGVVLFTRATKTKPVEVTPIGEKVIAGFYDILKTYRQLLFASQQAASAYSHDYLQVCYIPTMGGYKENELLAEFLIKYPEITIQRFAGNARRIIELIVNGRADVAFIPLLEGMDFLAGEYSRLNDKGIKIIEVMVSRMLSVGFPENHRMAHLDYLPKSLFPALSDETFIYETKDMKTPLYEKYNQQLFGFDKPQRTKYIDFIEPCLPLRYVSAGLGILPTSAFVPRKIENVVFVPVEGGNNVTVSLYYVYRTANPKRSVKRLTAFVEDTAPKLYSCGKLP